MNKLDFHFDTYNDTLLYTEDKDNLGISITQSWTTNQFIVFVWYKNEQAIREEYLNIYDALDAANEWYQRNILDNQRRFGGKVPSTNEFYQIMKKRSEEIKNGVDIE